MLNLQKECADSANQKLILFSINSIWTIFGEYGPKFLVSWIFLFSVSFQAKYKYMSIEYSFSGSGNYIIYSNLKFLDLTMFKIQGLLFKD